MVIFDNSWIIISDSHFECMITDTHNSYILLLSETHIAFRELRNELYYK